ncbi:hypothetical protein [Fischerella major]|nr:hypothetical protein [Fischerella major]
MNGSQFLIPKWLCDHFTLKLNDNFEELVRTGNRPWRDDCDRYIRSM